jgi:hypothetical protein
MLKHVSKDVKETAKFKETDETIFLQYYEKLWNTTHISEPELEWDSNHYTDTSITLDK